MTWDVFKTEVWYVCEECGGGRAVAYYGDLVATHTVCGQCGGMQQIRSVALFRRVVDDSERGIDQAIEVTHGSAPEEHSGAGDAAHADVDQQCEDDASIAFGLGIVVGNQNGGEECEDK